MDKVIKLIEILEFFTQEATSIDEDSDTLSIAGTNKNNILLKFIKLLEEAKKIGFTSEQVTILDENGIGQSLIELQERKDDNDPVTSWIINISKLPLLKILSPRDPEYRTILFVTKQGFSKFTNQIKNNPFSSNQNHFPESGRLKIFVRDMYVCFGGPNLWVQGLQECKNMPSEWPSKSSLPSEESIKKQVHVVPSENINIIPKHYLLTWGDISSNDAESFRKISALMLASCLVNVFYGIDKVVLRGIKHQELALIDKDEPAPNEKFLFLLQDTVEWIYAERVETRRSLLETRLTIDLPANESFIAGLSNHLERALKQSKEEYKFVILDRKDEYEKEKRELLKDIRNQAELYSIKIRDLQKGLLRDTLAGFVFVGLMGARIGKNVEPESYNNFDLIFKGLSVYFIVSFFLQIITSVVDINISIKELSRWIDQTRNYLEKETIENQITANLSGRKISFRVTTFFIGLLYLGIVLLSWNIGTFLCIGT